MGTGFCLIHQDIMKVMKAHIIESKSQTWSTLRNIILRKGIKNINDASKPPLTALRPNEIVPERLRIELI